MQSGTMLFKCRLCGEVWNGLHVEDALLGLMYAQGILRARDSMTPAEHAIHLCKEVDGYSDPVCGVGDLIGARYDRLKPCGQAAVPGGLIAMAGVKPSDSSFKSYVPTPPK